MANTLEQIMEGVTDGGYDYVNINDCIRIDKLYANAKLEEAASLGIVVIHKQSILNLREEV